MPFPSELATPPVTKMCFATEHHHSCASAVGGGTRHHRRMRLIGRWVGDDDAMAPTADRDAELAVDVADEAGRALLRIRAVGAATPELLGRAGDLDANELILERLRHSHPDDAILSEESTDDPARLDAARVWIVDPLDGTREFVVEGRTDWAVHIALWTRERGLTAAAVALPALGVTLSTTATPATTPGRDQATRLLFSASRTPSFAALLCEVLDGELMTMGSAGAKAMAVVRGDADAYVHSGGQWEWDSAAPVAVAMAYGLWCSRIDGSPLVYNQPHPYLPDLIICRPELADPILSALRRLDAD